MTRIALLGGSFNPPHLGHVGMAKYIVDQHLADEVWVLPTASHPYSKALLPFADRMAMCELAFQGIPHVIVTDIESKLPQPNFTVQTLRHLQKNFSHQWMFVVGSDAAADIPNWKDSAEILKIATIIEVPRGPHSVVHNASATEIRDRIAHNTPITDLVPAPVEQYIQSHQLYR